MVLVERTGFSTDPWQRLDDSDDLLAAQPLRIIVPLERLLRDFVDYAGPARLGVDLTNDTAVDDLLPVLQSLALIAITFPSSTDGRGFSLARKLRTAGFGGQLRATGPLIADQFAFALGCGFDAVEIPDTLALRQPEKQWLEALTDIENTYQSYYASAEA